METISSRLLECAVEWGPGMILALGIVFASYKFVSKVFLNVGMKIVGALEKPAAALTVQAEALTKQSVSMDRLTGALEEYVCRDRSEHREIIILLKVISERLDRMDERFEGKNGGS